MLHVILILLTSFIGLGQNANANQCKTHLKTEFSTNLLTNEYLEVINPNFIAQGSWASSLAYLAINGFLISQDDSKLGAMNLLEDGGGVCVPTCVAYIAASKDFHTSDRRSFYWVKNTHIFIDGLLRSYQEIALANNHPTGLNPRMGNILNFYTVDHNKKTAEMGVIIKIIDSLTAGEINYILQNLKGLIIGGVRQTDSRSTEPTGHAIIILALNTKDNLIVILDPNNPSKLLITDYKVENGIIYFKLDENWYGKSGANEFKLISAASFTLK